jgi:hypothetical protein
MLFLYGVPVEGFFGTPLTFLVFQAGVFGGTLGFLVWDNHAAIVGMSGGCYALLGLHVSDLMLNLKDKTFLKATAAFIAVWPIIQTISVYFMESQYTSHSEHVGGFLAGFLIFTAVGRNVDKLDWELKVQFAARLLLVVLIIFALAFGLSSKAPMELQDPVRYCWLRQVVSQEEFGDSEVHCVRCDDSQACIDRWSNVDVSDYISPHTCYGRYDGFNISQR